MTIAKSFRIPSRLRKAPRIITANISDFPRIFSGKRRNMEIKKRCLPTSSNQGTLVATAHIAHKESIKYIATAPQILVTLKCD